MKTVTPAAGTTASGIETEAIDDDVILKIGIVNLDVIEISSMTDQDAETVSVVVMVGESGEEVQRHRERGLRLLI